jgi:hypothetical protein
VKRAFALLVAAVATACGGSRHGAATVPPADDASTNKPPVQVGKAIAPWTAPRIDEPREVVRVPSARVTLLAVLATWSEPDKASLPGLQAIYAKYHPRGVDVVGLFVDDEKVGVVDFAKNFGVKFPLVWDERHSITALFGPEFEPSYLILDGTGRVRFKFGGYFDGQDAKMAAAVASLLAN